MFIAAETCPPNLQGPNQEAQSADPPRPGPVASNLSPVTTPLQVCGCTVCIICSYYNCFYWCSNDGKMFYVNMAVNARSRVLSRFFSRPTPIGGPWASHWLNKGGRREEEEEGGRTPSSTNREQIDQMEGHTLGPDPVTGPWVYAWIAFFSRICFI